MILTVTSSSAPTIHTYILVHQCHVYLWIELLVEGEDILKEKKAENQVIISLSKSTYSWPNKMEIYYQNG